MDYIDKYVEEKIHWNMVDESKHWAEGKKLLPESFIV